MAAALVGAWTGLDGPFHVVWTVARKDQAWSVSAVYMKGNAEHGSAHGENVNFSDGVLTFTRVFDKKPERDFPTNADIRMELKDGRLAYTAIAGSKTKHLTLQSANGK